MLAGLNLLWASTVSCHLVYSFLVRNDEQIKFRNAVIRSDKVTCFGRVWGIPERKGSPSLISEETFLFKNHTWMFSSPWLLTIILNMQINVIFLSSMRCEFNSCFFLRILWFSSVFMSIVPISKVWAYHHHGLIPYARSFQMEDKKELPSSEKCHLHFAC